MHRTLRKALTDAVRVERVLATNPAERAKLPRTRRGEPGTIWTPTQLAVFLELAAGHRLAPFFRLAAYTGDRRGELLGLRWPALDLDAAEVTLSGPTDVIDGERVEDTTNGGRSHVVSLDAGTVAAMPEHRRRQLAERMRVGPLWAETDLVFTTEDGRPVCPDTLTALMRKLVAEHNAPAVPGRGRGHHPLPPLWRLLLAGPLAPE